MTKKPEVKLTHAERIAARKAAIGSRKPATPKELAELREIYGSHVTCAGCGEDRPIESFGVRRDPRGGPVTRQPYCQQCRSFNYRAVPRVYKTKNS